ncbi:hypothetical protein IHQ56_13675 [Methylobacillus flagellatus]|uniref:hypothetical protein n=1 Tax=Methylobacillus flagellatus TaxID=405 RepID=UPI0028540A57|nr:hypothetical protein [Methylobacillus flagellatus]MDR5172871.1 hypothetical protein [Methylobacillus flagellatus]
MDDVIAAIRSCIESDTTLSVGVGHPKKVCTRIVIWPWRIASSQDLRSQTLPREAVDARRLPSPLFSLDFLLFSKEGVEPLIKVARVLEDYAVIELDDARYKLAEQPLDPELQVAILGNAGVPLQPVLRYIISQLSIASNAPTDVSAPILEKGRMIIK